MLERLPLPILSVRFLTVFPSSGRTMGTTSLINDEAIATRIHWIRGEKVILDEDLAGLYEVPTKRLNEQVKRNLERFPKEFMIQLNQEEWSNLKSQIATSSSWGGRRKLPLAFTEHGVLMLSNVLNSKRAIAVSIRIIRVFVRMNRILMNDRELMHRLERVEGQQEAHGEALHA